MTRILRIATVAMFALLLMSCSNTTAELKDTESITMDNIDNYLDYNARFIDLRNFADLFNGGYIAGFESVPFFQYLEGRALQRNNGWEFSSVDIISTAILENVFGPKDQAIVLMCGSGTRAGYVKSALDSIGYLKVYNAGGISDYHGNRKVLGDGVYNGLSELPAEVTMENIDSYLSRTGAKYVDLRNAKDIYIAGYIDGFENISFFEYLDTGPSSAIQAGNSPPRILCPRRFG